MKVFINKTEGLAATSEFEHLRPAVSNASLADVSVGAAATVLRVGGARGLSIRLMEMGLLPGTRVEVVRVAPLGDPIEVRLRGFSLSIRREEARGVEVEPLEPEG